LEDWILLLFSDWDLVIGDLGSPIVTDGLT